MIKTLAGLALDLTCLCGVASVVYGVALINIPAAYIVAGLTVSAAVIWKAKRWDS